MRVDQGFVKIKDKSILLVGWLGEIWRGACGKGFHCIIVFLNEVFIIIEIDGIKAKQLIKGPIDGHISVLKLNHQYFDLLKQHQITF